VHTEILFCKIICFETNMLANYMVLVLLSVIILIKARDSKNVISRKYLEARQNYNMNIYLSCNSNLHKKYYDTISYQNDFSFFAQIIRNRGCKLNGEIICLQCSSLKEFDVNKYCRRPRLNKILEINVIKKCSMKVIERTSFLRNFDCKNFQNSYIFTFS